MTRVGSQRHIKKMTLETVGICSCIYDLCDDRIGMSHYTASIVNCMILKQCMVLEWMRTEAVFT